MISNQFVYIIESPSKYNLLEGTMEGKALLESLCLAKIPTSYNLVIDREMLKISLTSKLIKECQNSGDKLPLLHLSMHGNEEGIELSNKDFVSWQELWELIAPLSNYMKGGLIICMSTCHGSYGSYMANFENHNLTYASLIGNISTTNWADAAVAYITFYHLYFKELSIDKCVETMKAASGDDGFRLHWGNEVRWQLRELNFEVTQLRQALGMNQPTAS